MGFASDMFNSYAANRAMRKARRTNYNERIDAAQSSKTMGSNIGYTMKEKSAQELQIARAKRAEKLQKNKRQQVFALIISLIGASALAYAAWTWFF